MKIIVIALILALSYKVRHAPSEVIIPYSIGVILLAGSFFGNLFDRIKLPKISGYLITGLIIGPNFIGLISSETLGNLELVRSLALVIIAMMAGFEFNLRLLKKEVAHIALLGFMTFIFIFGGVFFFSMLLMKFGFIYRVPAELIIVISAVLAIISTSKSPLSTIAIIEETGIKNRFSSIILGVTIFKDILLIFVFVILMFFLDIKLGSQAKLNLWLPIYELLGSIFIGTAFGWFFHLYFKWANSRNTMMLILMAFIIGEISRLLHLNALLFGLTIGFVVGNYSRQKRQLERSLREANAVILIIFFALNGAWIKKEWLTSLWIVSILITVVRAILIFAGVWLAEVVKGHSRAMKKYGWTGFINQSGIALAIALLIKQTYPTLGEMVYPIVLGMIVITDFLAPPIFKWALLKSKDEKD